MSMIPEDSRPLSPRSLSRRQFLSSAAALGGAASLGALAGCTSDSKPTATATGQAPTQTLDSAVLYPDGYVGPKAYKVTPIVKVTEKATLRVAIVSDQVVGDWANNAATKFYEERTGVHIEWQVLSSTDTQTKINAILASGDLPDMFFPGLAAFNPAQQALYGSQGLFIPLNDLIDRYGFHSRQLFDAFPDARKVVTAPDGKIYSLPNLISVPHFNSVSTLYVYKPWLDKLGLKVPTTLDEMEEVLTAFKTGDPNGNGKADEIPLSGDNDSFGLGDLDRYFMCSFMYNPGRPWLFLDNGRVDVAYNKPEWREGLRYLRRLYSKGLIYENTFTMPLEQLLKLTQSPTPIVGAIKSMNYASFLAGPDLDSTNPKARYRELIAIPPLKGPSGNPVAQWNYFSGIETGKCTITKNCKNPEIAFMWADGLYELTMQNYIRYGVRDKDWRWATSTEKGSDRQQSIITPLHPAPPTIGSSWNNHTLLYVAEDTSLGETTDQAVPNPNTQAYQEAQSSYYPYRQDKSKQLPPVTLNQDQTNRSATISTSLSNNVLESIAKFTTGQLNIDDEGAWNGYLDTLNKIGLKQYLSAYQEAYEQSPFK